MTFASIKSSLTLYPATRLLIAEAYISFRENLPCCITYQYTFKMWSCLPDPGKSITTSKSYLGLFGKFNPFIFIIITTIFGFISALILAKLC